MPGMWSQFQSTGAIELFPFLAANRYFRLPGTPTAKDHGGPWAGQYGFGGARMACGSIFWICAGNQLVVSRFLVPAARPCPGQIQGQACMTACGPKQSLDRGPSNVRLMRTHEFAIAALAL